MVDQLEKTLARIVMGADAERYHTVRTIKTETVGHHSHMVGGLCLLLSTDWPDALERVQLFTAAIVHDLAEGGVGPMQGSIAPGLGDVPSTTKLASPLLKSVLDDLEEVVMLGSGLNYDLTTKVKRTLKIADYLAGMIYCVQEARLGSRMMSAPYKVYYSYLYENMDRDFGRAWALHGLIDKWWREQESPRW